jgi:hypothetical protein
MRCWLPRLFFGLDDFTVFTVSGFFGQDHFTVFTVSRFFGLDDFTVFTVSAFVGLSTMFFFLGLDNFAVFTVFAFFVLTPFCLVYYCRLSIFSLRPQQLPTPNVSVISYVNGACFELLQPLAPSVLYIIAVSVFSFSLSYFNSWS